MTETYHLTSERNRRIIVTSTNLTQLKVIRDKLNKLDKDFIKTTDMKLNAVTLR